jgi:hypothetical protein
LGHMQQGHDRALSSAAMGTPKSPTGRLFHQAFNHLPFNELLSL